MARGEALGNFSDEQNLRNLSLRTATSTTTKRTIMAKTTTTATGMTRTPRLIKSYLYRLPLKFSGPRRFINKCNYKFVKTVSHRSPCTRALHLSSISLGVGAGPSKPLNIGFTIQILLTPFACHGRVLLQLGGPILAPALVVLCSGHTQRE